MKLSDELYNEIIDSMAVVGRDEPRDADRRAPRVRLSSHVAVALWSDPLSPLSVRVQDLSQGGAGVVHSQRIALDEEMVIRFPRRDGMTALVLGKVVYWEPLSENLYGIGVQFESMIEEEQVSRQADRSASRQMNQLSVVARFTQSFARTWRIAS